jgi:hypothetical protein
MWVVLKKLFSQSKSLNALLGDVVFLTPREQGASAHSFFEWRVKASLDNSKIYIAVALKPDGYAGPEGSPTNYIQFDLDTAVRLRDSLNDCIEHARQLPQSVGARSPHGSSLS